MTSRILNSANLKNLKIHQPVPPYKQFLETCSPLQMTPDIKTFSHIFDHYFLIKGNGTTKKILILQSTKRVNELPSINKNMDVGKN